MFVCLSVKQQVGERPGPRRWGLESESLALKFYLGVPKTRRQESCREPDPGADIITFFFKQGNKSQGDLEILETDFSFVRGRL